MNNVSCFSDIHNKLTILQPPEPKINYDCTGKADGFYSLSDCNEKYVQVD